MPVSTPFTSPTNGPTHLSWRAWTWNRSPTRFAAAYATSSNPRSADSSERSTRVSADAPSRTVIAATSRNSQIRRRMAQPWPPTIACQTLVTKDGTRSRAIAFGRLIATARRARLTVGRPRPMTPLTAPASRKVPAIERMAPASSIPLFLWRRSSMRPRRAALPVG